MNQLGDLLFSLPVLSSLSAKSGNQVYSVIRPGFKSLLESSSLVNGIYLRENNILDKIKLAQQIKSEKFDLAIILSESLESKLIAYWSKIPRRVGFAKTLGEFLFTDKVGQSGVPSTKNNLSLLKHIGITPAKTDYLGMINVNDSGKSETKKLLEDYGIQENDYIIVVAPGTSKRRKEKSWTEPQFARVIREAKADKPIKWILVGSEENMPSAELIVKYSHGSSVVNLTGLTDLLDLTEILSFANAVLTVDNGIMHLAASMNIPVVALFGPTNPELIGPQGEGHCIIKKNTMEEIRPEEVISTIETVLKKER